MSSDTGSLAQALEALRTRWRLLLLVAVPVLLGAVFYAERLPAEYDGVAVVAFSPRPESGTSADTLRITAPKYVAYVTGPTSLTAVARELGEPPDDLDGSLDAALEPETANLVVTVRLDDPERAARAANAFAAAAVAFSRDDDLLAGQIVSPAVAEPVPASPPRRLIEAAGLVVGLLFAVALAFVVERSRPRVRRASDAEVVTGYPVLGRVPRARAARDPGTALADPAVGAAVRTLRTHLERESRARPVGVLAVTSAGPGEGKTTVTLVLAAALARLDARILVLDVDTERPGVARALGLEQAGPGLAAVLHGTATLADTATPVEALAGVHVVTGAPGEEPGGLGDLLARRLGALLDTARESYDVVLLDCPPVLGSDNARTAATHADATLFVVAAGGLSAPVDEAARVLRSLRVRVLGGVLNRSLERTDRPEYAYAR